MTLSTKTIFAALVIYFTAICFPAYNQSFESTSDVFLPTYSGNIEWADLDNDNDLDLMYCGFLDGGHADPIKVYRNDAGSFTKIEVSLPAMRNGQFALGDYDLDGDLDVLLSGLRGNGPAISELYQNDGGLSFSLKYSFPGVFNSTVSWVDLDNDEDLDFLIGGVDYDTDAVKIFVYENTGGTFVPLDNTNLPPCMQCSMDWADANGDGKVDLLVTGIAGEAGHPATDLYINNGDRTFTLDENANLPDAYNGTAAWGDVDMDGDMDIFLCGSSQQNSVFTQIFENKKGSFEPFTGPTLPPLVDNYYRGARWVDFDYDGYLDLVLSGRTSHINIGTVLALYKNIGGPTLFSEVPEATFDGLSSSSIDFGDFDNDGDADMAYLGHTPTGTSTGIFRNVATQSAPKVNTAPSPPSAASLTEISASRKELLLGWGHGSDTETPAEGLSYNFYVRNAAGMIAAPNANRTTGFLTSHNNPTGHRLITRLNDIPEGELFLAVQSIDGSKTGSVFSSEKRFYQINGPEALKAVITPDQEVLLTWIDNSQVESNYQIRRATIPYGPYEDVGALPANTTSFLDSYSFATETYYYYRIHAINTEKTSAYDSLKIVIPAAPGNLVAEPVNASTITLTWTDDSQFEHGYVVERKLSSAADFEIIGTLSSNTTSMEDPGLSEGTAYTYRVKAINEYGSSAFSHIVNATTKFRPVGLDFAKESVEDSPLTFTLTDFTSNFTDQDIGDELVTVKIITLPTDSELTLNGVAVVAGEVIPSGQLDQLVFLPEPDVNGLKTIEFNVRDATDEALTNSTINISIAPINDPPAFTIGSLDDLPEDFEGQIKIQPTPRAVPSDEVSQNVFYSTTPATSGKVGIDLNKDTGELTLTAVNNEFGTIALTLTADDGQAENGTFSQEVIINILPVNDPPVISDIPDVQVDFLEDIAPIEFTVEDVDDPIEEITLSAVVDANPLVNEKNITFSGDGSTRQVHIAKELRTLGVAAITISASDGSASTSEQFTVTTFTITSTIPTFASEITVYPNPFTSTLQVDLDDWNGNEAVTLVIHDIFGNEHARAVTTDRLETLSLDDLPYGIYFLDITSGAGRGIRKKIMKR